MVLDENTRLFAVVADKYQAEGNPEVVLKGCEDRIIQLPDLALLTTDDASARNEFPIGAEDRWNMPFSRYEILIRDTFGSELRLAITEMAEETQIIPVILGFSEGNVEAIGRLTDNGKSNTLNSFGYFEERWLLQKDGSHILAICVPHSSLAYSSPLQIHPKPNLYAALSELVFLLCRNMPAQKAVANEKVLRDSERIKQMLRYIQQNYAEALTLADIARSAMIGESECLRCFKGTIGMAPIQYVKRFRVQKAAELLSSTDERIADIGAQCGFQDSSYFTRSFREIKGMSPVEYRRLNGNGGE